MSRNILFVALVSLFTDLSSQMVFPVIPLYLVSIGAGAWVIGIVEGAAETTASLLKVYSGYWSDRIRRRKPFIFSGYGVSSFTKPLFAFASSWPLVLVIRVIERVGKGVRNAPRDAIIAESADASVRGKAFGFHRAMDGIGSISGAILAVALLPLLGFQQLFLIAFIPGVIALVWIMFIKETPHQKRIHTKQSLRVSIGDLPLNLKIFILVAAVFAAGHFGYAFLLLRARNIGLSNDTALLLYVLFYIVYTICIIPAGILSDSIGRKPVLFLGYGLFATTTLLLLFSASPLVLVGVFVAYGFFYAFIDGVQRAYVVDLAPDQLKATALGTFHTVIGLVALPGGFIAGVLWDVFAPEGTFMFGFLLTVSAILLFSFVKK